MAKEKIPTVEWLISTVGIFSLGRNRWLDYLMYFTFEASRGLASGCSSG